MTTYTVRLTDDTIGTINDNTLDGQRPAAFIGDEVNVHLHDENGQHIEVRGIPAEVLGEA